MMIFSLFLSFLSGLVAALNPCTTPIYPIVFSYYLKKDGRVTFKNVASFCIGFIGAFLLVALIIISFGAIGGVQEFIRFAVAGIVALFGLHILLRGFQLPNALLDSLNKIESPFLFGAVFGLALNPCSLPLFLTTIALTAVDAFSVLHILAFGIGVAIPPILAAIFGSALIKNMASRVTGAYRYLDRIVGSFLLIAAAFIIWGVSSSPTVAVLASASILSFFSLLIAPFWKRIYHVHKDRTALYTLTVFLLLLWGVLTFHCYTVSFTTQFACHGVCLPCRLCTALLIGVLAVGYVGFHALERQQ